MNLRPYSYRSDDSVPVFKDDKDIIVFDGHCALCSAWVRFILRHDHQARYRFIPASSELGQALYRHYHLNPSAYETNILLAGGLPWFKSEGSIRMFTGLGFPWSLMNLARILPLRVREAFYNHIATNRYRWFGRNQTCYLPNQEMKDRFLA